MGKLNKLHGYEFDYLRCDGKLINAHYAEDEYGFFGVAEHCSPIEIKVTVYEGRTWKEAKQKMIQLLKEIIKTEEEGD